MKVTYELFKGKMLKSGEYPVMIRVYHQKNKYLATGVSTKAEHWNEAKRTVTSKDKLYKEKNKAILDKYMHIMQRISEFDAIDLEYDLELLVSDKVITKEDTPVASETKNYDNFIDIIDKMTANYNEGSARKYYQLKNNLVELYGNNIPISAINKDWFVNYERKLAPKGVKQAKELIKRFITVHKFGLDEGYIKNFVSLKYNPKNYQAVIEKRTLDSEGFTFLQSQYEREHKAHIDKWFKENIPYPYLTTNYFNALNLFMLMVAFDGLAPIDLSLLRLSDLKKKKFNIVPLDYMQINDEDYLKEYNATNQIVEYYSIKLLRKKTKVQVDIKLPCALIDYLIKPYLYTKEKELKTENDFILNVFDKNTFDDMTDKQIYSRMSNYWNSLATSLNKYISSHPIAPASLKERKLTYYAARHTALNVLLDKGVGIEDVAKMAGHNVETLQKSYIGEFDIRKKVENNMKVWNLQYIKREVKPSIVDDNVDNLNETEFEII